MQLRHSYKNSLYTLALIVLATQGVRADVTTPFTPINYIPYVVNNPGNYCLTRSFTRPLVGQKAIDIRSNNATIDFKGHSITNSSTLYNNISVYAAHKSFVHIKNGYLINFDTGIVSYGYNSTSYGNVIENMTIDTVSRTGIYISGQYNRVIDNKVTGIGKSTYAYYLTAIYNNGNNNSIKNNVIDSMKAPSGSVAYGNDVQLFEFSLDESATVTLRTWSYAGGINAAGDTINDGGFDPIITLFDGMGNLISYNDDGLGVAADPMTDSDYDALITTELEPGNYFAALVQFDNYANGPTLADGFQGTDTRNFLDDNGDYRTGAWAFDLFNVTQATPIANAAVPEPSSFLLIGFGLMGIVLIRKNKAKHCIQKNIT